MGGRGQKSQYKVRIKWSPNFAYAVGLLTADGSLSKDGRHLDFTSKDKQQLKNFLKCLNKKVKIGQKISGYNGNKCGHVQFGDVVLYKFLTKIGLTPNKSKTMGKLIMPKKYFFDFLRGHFDGDGSIYSYWDRRWKSSFMFYTSFVSASRKHIDWLQKTIFELVRISGHITKSKNDVVYQLKYAKKESKALFKKLYGDKNCVFLKRKYNKWYKILQIDKKRECCNGSQAGLRCQ